MFTPVLRMPALRGKEETSGWAEMIEAVERADGHLDHSAVGPDFMSGQAGVIASGAYPLVRRRADAVGG